jgi:hypothetical protein
VKAKARRVKKPVRGAAATKKIKKKMTMKKAPPGKVTARPRATARAKPAKRVPPPAVPPTTPKTAEETAFLESLIVHGQAARARPDGTLPPGATHELVEDARGDVRAVRRRFSTF